MTVLSESPQLPQVISSTSEPHSANPMWSLWIPQEPPLFQPGDLSISVSSAVGGGRDAILTIPAHSLHFLGNSIPPREVGRG